MRSFLLCLPLAALCGAAQDHAPSDREISGLVEEYLALDPRTADGRKQERVLLAELERVPAPSASQVKTWTSRIHKLWAKGRELEKKSGQFHWWEDEQRGFFVLGGETKRPKAIFLGLHGGGVGSGDATSSAGAYGSACSNLDWVGIFPEVLEKTEHGWTDAGTEEWVLDLLDAALRTWKVGPERVFMGGHSMGGYGTWVLGAHHADRFAGLAASAGAPSPYLDAGGKVIGIQEGVIPNLRNTPLVVFQSVDDPQVPPDANQAAVAELEKARERWGGYGRFEYWEVDGYGHGFPDKGPIELLEKVAEDERQAFPPILVWQPSLAWKRQFYWLLWEEPRANAVVRAEVDPKARSVAVTLDGDASGLSVLLRDELLDVDKEVVVTLNGAEVFRGVPPTHFPTLVRTAATGDPERTYAVRVPLVP